MRLRWVLMHIASALAIAPRQLQAQPYCVQIITGAGSFDKGDVEVQVDSGGGPQEEASGAHDASETVLDKCYDFVLSVQVRGTSNDAWAGTVRLTFGGQDVTLTCPTCTGIQSPLTEKVVVDGHNGGDSPAMGDTHCLGGTACKILTKVTYDWESGTDPWTRLPGGAAFQDAPRQLPAAAFAACSASPPCPGDGCQCTGNHFVVTSEDNLGSVAGEWTGTLESPAFLLTSETTIEFSIGGGNHPAGSLDPGSPPSPGPDEACALTLEVLSGGAWVVIASATGTGVDTLTADDWGPAELGSYAGYAARLRIYDLNTNGHIALDDITMIATRFEAPCAPDGGANSVACACGDGLCEASQRCVDDNGEDVCQAPCPDTGDPNGVDCACGTVLCDASDTCTDGTCQEWTEVPSCAPGGPQSSAYPCTCGTATCQTDERCFPDPPSSCQACPAGYQLEAQGCEQCNVGYFSEEGDRCSMLLAYAAGQLQNPTLLVVRDINTEITTMTLTLDPLPSPVFGPHQLIYVIDVQESRPEISLTQDCRDEWNVSTGEATIELTYTQFSGPCRLTATPQSGNISRDGVVGIYVVSVNETGHDVQWERLWTIDLNLQFRTETLSYLTGDFTVNGYFELNDTQFHLGDFLSYLTIYDEADYLTIVPQPYRFEVGEPVHVQHALSHIEEDLELEVQMVFLSRSLDPSDAGSIEYDFSDQLTHHPSPGPSVARFTFIARRCDSCILHVVSEVVHSGGRRLLAAQHILSTVQSIYVELTEAQATTEPSSPPAGPHVHIQLVIHGLDYNRLVANPDLYEQVARELRSQIVETLWPGDARQVDVVVRLSPASGAVIVDIDIVLPAYVDAMVISAALQAESFELTVEDGVTESIGSIADIAAVTSGPMSTDVVSIEFSGQPTEDKGDVQAQQDQGSGVLVAVIVVLSISLVAVLIFAASLWHCQAAERKRQSIATTHVEAINAATEELGNATEDLKRQAKPRLRADVEDVDKDSILEGGIPGVPHLV